MWWSIFYIFSNIFLKKFIIINLTKEKKIFVRDKRNSTFLKAEIQDLKKKTKTDKMK